MKCPKCHKEVEDHMRFCPYCGEDLHSSQKPHKRPLLRYMMMIAAFLMVISVILLPTAISNMNTFDWTWTTTTNQQKIGKVTNSKMNALAYEYETKSEFENEISNAEDFIKPVENYVKSLNELYGVTFTSRYYIKVYTNNDVHIRVTNVAALDDTHMLTIIRFFNRTGETDTIINRYKKTGCKEFSDMILEDDPVVKTFLGNKAKKLTRAFRKKEARFLEVKDHLGHLGLGVYKEDQEDYYSQVIYKDGELYKVEVEDTTKGDGSLAV